MRYAHNLNAHVQKKVSGQQIKYIDMKVQNKKIVSKNMSHDR